MTKPDLESRLRRYAPVLDAATPDLDLDPPDELERRRRNAGRLLVAGVAAAIVATAAVVLVTTDRRQPTDVAEPVGGAATEPSADTDPRSERVPGEPDTAMRPAPATLPNPRGPSGRSYAQDELYPVVLADGLVPWYDIDPEAVAGREPLAGRETVQLDGGQQILACTDWEVIDESVLCSELELDGLSPVYTYAYPDSAWVTVSTMHRAAYSAAQYAHDHSSRDRSSRGPYGIDPYEWQDTTVGDRDAYYTSTDESEASGGPHSIRRITVDVGADSYVAVETRGFTREELTAFAETVRPVGLDGAVVDDLSGAVLGQIPLVLATAGTEPGPGERRSGLLGGVVDGQLCVFAPSYIISDVQDPCTVVDDTLIVLHADLPGIPGEYLGVAGPGVAELRIDFTDGSHLTVIPPEQPIGETRPFAVRYPTVRGAAVTALDADGNELATVPIEPPIDPATSEPVADW